MSTREEQTREEIIRTMSALTEALTIQNKALMRLLQSTEPRAEAKPEPLVITATVTSPDANPPTPAPEKKARKQKSAAEMVAEMKPAPAPVADITPEPVVKTATLADLRLALQQCMDKHGMEKAKALLGYERLSVVPDADIPTVIARLQAA